MKDIIHNFLKKLDYNRWTYILLIVAMLGMSICFVGCQPTTAGLENPNVKVDAAGLQTQILKARQNLGEMKSTIDKATADYNAKVETLNGQITNAQEDLLRQETIRQQTLDLLGAGAVAAVNGTANPANFIIPALSLIGAAFGVGKTIDNRRKDAVIATKDEELAAQQQKIDSLRLTNG